MFGPFMALWCNWLTRRPLKAKSPGSSPGNATKNFNKINDSRFRLYRTALCTESYTEYRYSDAPARGCTDSTIEPPVPLGFPQNQRDPRPSVREQN
jgi:hypothetical protein